MLLILAGTILPCEMHLHLIWICILVDNSSSHDILLYIISKICNIIHPRIYSVTEPNLHPNSTLQRLKLVGSNGFAIKCELLSVLTYVSVVTSANIELFYVRRCDNRWGMRVAGACWTRTARLSSEAYNKQGEKSDSRQQSSWGGEPPCGGVNSDWQI